MPPANRRNGFLSLVVLAVANPKESFALNAPPNACRSCEQVEISLRASKQLLLSSKFASRSIGATLEAGSLWVDLVTWTRNHCGCSKPQSGPATAPQRESAGLKPIGMTVMVTRGRRVAKRQRQWSTSASFRNPFAKGSAHSQK
jgi:hypothetical protein